MENFNDEQLSSLSSNSEKFHQQMELSAQWVKKNLKLEEQHTLLHNINKSKSEIHTISESIETNPVFALFGVSQVGKSYLVKYLLASENNRLEIEMPDGEKIDFLDSINPEGNGAEATGVVSRFSVHSEYIDPEYPIAVKLLDVKDILLILCDTFFADIIQLESYPSKEDFLAHALKYEAKYEGKANTQHELIVDDLYFVNKYFEKFIHRSSNLAVEVSRSHFWLTVSGYIEKVDPSGWSSLFEILWAFDPHFTELFERMLQGLKTVRFSNEIYVTKNAVLREKGKIVDVVRINGIYGQEEVTKILMPDRTTAAIDLHILSALTAEITMPLSPKIAEQKEFLKSTDLLDFPGARSRKPFEKESVNQSLIPTLLLRGKISYLFNKYSSNYDINNLLFCIKNVQNEVKEIPLLINDWIESNVGENNVKREERIGKTGTSPLFIVLTFYNETLKYNRNSDQGDLSGKWENRFVRFFNEEIVTKENDWDENWTESQKQFQSFYMLRDYEHSGHLFEGFAKNGSETGIVEDKQEYYERLKQSFIDYPYVKEHFKDPLEAWEASSTPNRDGSQRIVDDLLPAANNLIKTKNYIKLLEEFKEKTLQKLKPHFKTDDIQRQRKVAKEQGDRIKLQLQNLFNGEESKFGDYLSRMHLSEPEVYNYIHKNYLPASNDHTPRPEEVTLRTYNLDLNLSMEENKVILQNELSLETIEDVDKWLVENNIDLNEVLKKVHISAASTLVDGVLDMWKANLNVERFKDLSAYGLDMNSVVLVNENLIQTFEIFQVREDLIRLFEKKTRLMRVSNDTDEYLASIICRYINDFVSNFGFNFMSEERLEQIMILAKENNIATDPLMLEHEPVTDSVIEHIFDEDDSSNTLPITYPVVDHYKSFITKISLILLSNCGFRTYDLEENEKLGNIIEEIDKLTFNI